MYPVPVEVHVRDVEGGIAATHVFEALVSSDTRIVVDGRVLPAGGDLAARVNSAFSRKHPRTWQIDFTVDPIPLDARSIQTTGTP
jgi:hypothetical protein